MQREAECHGHHRARIPHGHHHGLKASDSSRERLVAQARVRQRPHSLRTNHRGPGQHLNPDTSKQAHIPNGSSSRLEGIRFTARTPRRASTSPPAPHSLRTNHRGPGHTSTKTHPTGRTSHMGHHHGLKASDSSRERLVAQARVSQRLTPFALTTVDRDILKPDRMDTMAPGFPTHKIQSFKLLFSQAFAKRITSPGTPATTTHDKRSHQY